MGEIFREHEEEAPQQEIIIKEPEQPAEKPQEEKEPEVQKKGISRRGFLKKAALGLAAVSAAGLLAENEVKADETQKPESSTKKESEKKLALHLETERQGDYEYVKGLIEKGKFEEKVDYLKKEYGNFPGRFLRDAEFAIKSVKEIEKDKQEGRKDIFVDPDYVYGTTKGSFFSSLFKPRWETLSKKEKLLKCGDLKIDGFGGTEKPQGEWKGNVPTNEEIKAELGKLYPPQWLRGSTKEIAFSKKELGKAKKDKTEERYGIKNMRVIGSTGAELAGRSKIEIFSHDTNGKYPLMGTIHHELAHDNDWEDSQILSQGQRIDFLCDATKAFQATENFASPYVYSIENKDKKLESYLRVKEYWAEAVRQYMQEGKESYKMTNPTEAELVEKWFDIINDKEDRSK